MIKRWFWLSISSYAFLFYSLIYIHYSRNCCSYIKQMRDVQLTFAWHWRIYSRRSPQAFYPMPFERTNTSTRHILLHNRQPHVLLFVLHSTKWRIYELQKLHLQRHHRRCNDYVSLSCAYNYLHPPGITIHPLFYVALTHLSKSYTSDSWKLWLM